MLLKRALAVVTGGSSGIGFATAERFVSEGARVVISGRNADKLAQAAKKLGENALAVVADAASPKDMQRLYESAVRHFQCDKRGGRECRHFPANTRARDDVGAILRRAQRQCWRSLRDCTRVAAVSRSTCIDHPCCVACGQSGHEAFLCVLCVESSGGFARQELCRRVRRARHTRQQHFTRGCGYADLRYIGNIQRTTAAMVECHSDEAAGQAR